MAPPWRFSNFHQEPEKISYNWLKLALFGISKNCKYFRSEMEIQKSEKSNGPRRNMRGTLKTAVAISNLSYVTSGSLLAPIPNFQKGLQ